MSNRELLLPGAIVAVLLVLATAATLPYAYYQFLRWATCPAAILFAIRGNSTGRLWAPYVFVPIAILFNPLWPVHMPKADWRPYDIAAAAVFVSFGMLPTRRQ